MPGTSGGGLDPHEQWLRESRGASGWPRRLGDVVVVGVGAVAIVVGSTFLGAALLVITDHDPRRRQTVGEAGGLLIIAGFLLFAGVAAVALRVGRHRDRPPVAPARWAAKPPVRREPVPAPPTVPVGECWWVTTLPPDLSVLPVLPDVPHELEAKPPDGSPAPRITLAGVALSLLVILAAALFLLLSMCSFRV